MQAAPAVFLTPLKTFSQPFVGVAFGEIHWQPPIWSRPIGRFIQGHRIAVSLVTLCVLASAIAVYVFEHLPQPEFSKVYATAPDITPLEKDLKPKPATIVFDKSVVPLSKIGATVNLPMTPSLAGEWKWKYDNTLVFSPATDWPPATRYQVTLPESELAQGVRLKTNVVEFVTNPLEVKFKDSQFYQDPVDVEKRQVIATIESNFPIELDALRKQASLDVLGGSNLFGGKQPFEIVADLHQRRIFFRTTNSTFSEKKNIFPRALRRGLPTAPRTPQT